jgi:hypothetical protein
VVETKVREHPILFSGPMIRAILSGQKTVTRRVVRPQFGKLWGQGVRHGAGCYAAHVDIPAPDGWKWLYCPYGKKGSKLWVRETWVNNFGQLLYRADCHPDSFEHGAKGWRPSIHMPRWASRLTLEVTGVRVERVRDISEKDAKAEGYPGRSVTNGFAGPVEWFRSLWDEINPKTPWSTSPWVWVVLFKRVQP